MSIPDLLKSGLERHSKGEYQKAEQCYQQILEEDPRHAYALNLLGILAHQTGRLDLAVERFQRAIEIDPAMAQYSSNLGNTLNEQKRFFESESCLRKAIELKPGFAEAQNNLGVSLLGQRKIEPAQEAFLRALALRPNYPQAHSNLGDAYVEAAQPGKAIECYIEALRFDPNLAEALNNLGSVYVSQGEYVRAEEALQRALLLRKDSPRTHYNFGVALLHQGKYGSAIQHLLEAARLQPDFAEAHNNLGVALTAQGKHQAAVDSYVESIVLKPDYAEAHSNLLLSLNYLSDMSAHSLFQEHLRWAERHAAPLASEIRPRSTKHPTDRKLRIGYVSPDFKTHSVAFFFEPVLASHDRERFELYCYSDVARPDGVTARIESLADGWRVIHGMTDARVADLIREDQIDLLVDLAGHTAGNRMLVFARKPALVQATYIGYPNTTGLATMDYRITDGLADPEGIAEELHTERLIRLPHGFLCYQPPADCPPPSPPPVLENGFITFGSFNNTAKMTLPAIAAWASILRELPDSRLLLKARQLEDPETRQYLLDRFAQEGIEAARIRAFGPRQPIPEHLAHYSHVDIGLDPFPFNGATTTCEALWMGVPVIALAGDRHAGRVGLSLLFRVGLGELVAETTEDYVRKAIELASDVSRLVRIRKGLRERMRESSLTHAPLVTRSLEEAYRGMIKG